MKADLLQYVDYNDILRFLHYKKTEIDEDIKMQLDNAVDIVFENANFTHIIEKKKIIYKNDEKIILENNIDLPYKSFAKLFKNSEYVYIVACTLGHNIPRLIKRELVIEPSKAVIIDSASSVIVDAYAEYIQRQHGKTTSRFSPGYGDVPLETQKIFSKILDMTKKAGIHLTDGNLMIPEKSIVFLMGDLQEYSSKNDTLSCNSCPRDCVYRKEKNEQI